MRGAILLLTLAGVAAAQDRPASWMGELVVGKKYAKDITFGDQVNGKQEWFEFRGIYPITVREDRDGWLRIFDGHREGWAKKDEFVLSKDAPAYFTDRIRTDAKDEFAWWARGRGWQERKAYDKAIRDYDECIRLVPDWASAFNSRGVCWVMKEEYARAIRDFDEAIRFDTARGITAVVFNNRGFAHGARDDREASFKDYEESIRLDPKYPAPWTNRGLARLRMGDYDGALRDLDAAIQRNPNGAKPHHDRALALLTARRRGAVEGCRKAIELADGADELRSHTAVVGNLAARLEKDDVAAKAFLADAGKLKAEWPEPVVRFLCGDLDEPGLLRIAADRKKETEARTYLGLDHLIRGNRDAARAHFRWVKESGVRTGISYTLAVAELARLEKGGAAKE